MTTFENIKKWYEIGIWNDSLILFAYEHKYITKEEMESILKGE